MLFHAGTDREDVRVADNIGRINAQFVNEDPVGPGADGNTAFGVVSLTVFVKGHNDHGGAVALAQPRLLQEAASFSTTGGMSL